VENQFSHVTDICFRDSASKMFFDKMPNVRWAPDVVFGLNQPVGVPQKKIVISVIKCNRKGRPSALAAQTQVYEIVLTEVCAILSRLGYSICLMSFCEPQGDGETAINIKNRCLDSKIENVTEYHYSGNVEEALQIIAESERVIATRFHMMILGWVMTKPVYPLIYDQKMRRVLEDTGFFEGKEIIELKRNDAEEIANCLLELLPENCDNQRIESVKQFEELDKFIMEKNYVDGF
jgi:colanic acid/amylovoran biosynthesis protein